MRLTKKFKLIHFLLCALFIAVMFFGAADDSLTHDEVVHISSGWTYAKYGTIRLNYQHPPLFKLLSGVFILPLKPNFPFSFREQAIYGGERLDGAGKDQWKFGYAFFYRSNNDPDNLLLFGRIPAVLMAFGIVLVCFYWTRRITKSVWAGMLAMILAMLSPIILAHGRLANTDTPVALFYALSFFGFIRMLEKKSVKRAVVFGCMVGIALGMKYSALIIPIIIMFLIIHRFMTYPEDWFDRKRIFRLMGIAFISGCMTLWLIYVIAQRNEIFNNRRYQLPIVQEAAISHPIAKALLVPIATYYKGFDIVFHHSRDGHIAYYLQQPHQTGHRDYFLMAFLLKTPIPAIILFIFAVALVRRKKCQEHYDFFVLWVMFYAYFAAALVNNIHIGVRHLMPIYPAMMILSSAGIWELTKIRWWRWFIGALMGLLAIDTAYHYPSYLPYFNQLIGSNHSSYQYLADSNTYWGQDDKRMGWFLLENHIETVYVFHQYWTLKDMGIRTQVYDYDTRLESGDFFLMSMAEKAILPERMGRSIVSSIMKGIRCICTRKMINAKIFYDNDHNGLFRFSII